MVEGEIDGVAGFFLGALPGRDNLLKRLGSHYNGSRFTRLRNRSVVRTANAAHRENITG
jgi:hypothetical protein